jgi:hypothetical protein
MSLRSSGRQQAPVRWCKLRETIKVNEDPREARLDRSLVWHGLVMRIVPRTRPDVRSNLTMRSGSNVTTSRMVSPLSTISRISPPARRSITFATANDRHEGQRILRLQ